MTDDLRDRIAAVIASGRMDRSNYELAEAVTDLLIDMAGQGELLKAIDRMYR